MRLSVFSIIIWLACVFPYNSDAQRYLCHGLGNLERDNNHGLNVMNKMVGAGCNSTLLTVWWDRVYPKPNSTPDWAQLDNQIDHAVNNLKIKVAIRIHLGRHIASINGFYNLEEAVTDFKGKPQTMYYDNNHFSFAHQPSVEKGGSFVKEVCERYKKLQQQGHIIFISVVNTPTQEIGYNYDNQQYPAAPYPAVFDHSRWAMIKWKEWAKSKYKTIRTLNTYWRTSYKSFDEVEPYVNWGNVKDSFNGQRGKDWYYFRHLMLKNYIDYMTRTIKSVDPGYNVACEYGGISDDLTLLRGTFGFKDLSENIDIVKTSTDAFRGDGMQGDLVISNLKPNQKFYTEVAHFDLPTPEALRNYVTRAAEYGCNFIMLGADYDNGKDIEKILPAVIEGVKWINRPTPPIVFADTMNYRISQFIDNRDAVADDWKKRSENGKKKIKFNYDEDIIKEKHVIDNPLPDIVSGNPNEPTKPPVKEGPNDIPTANTNAYTFNVVLDESFVLRIPNNLFVDPDGYIAYIELINPPGWLKFNQFEFSFYGRPTAAGKIPVNLRVYDNMGASIESVVYFDCALPNINFELIKATYFENPIESRGWIDNNTILYAENLPEKLNILARCNLNSVIFKFELNGPYKFERISERVPHNLFGEGEIRGMKFPLGRYSLTAKVYRNDSLITSKSIHFTVKYSLDASKKILPDWVVYPNPFLDVCNIKLPAEESFDMLAFTLISSSGKRIPVSKQYIQYVDGVAYIDMGAMGVMGGSYLLEVNKQDMVLNRIRVIKI